MCLEHYAPHDVLCELQRYSYITNTVLLICVMFVKNVRALMLKRFVKQTLFKILKCNISNRFHMFSL